MDVRRELGSRWRRVAIVAVAASLAVAGCGSEGDGDGGSSESGADAGLVVRGTATSPTRECALLGWNLGASVDVLDADGELVAEGALTTVQRGDVGCTAAFEVEEVPDGEDGYQVVVVAEDPVDLTADELRAPLELTYP